jgi:hypothetical protein
MVNMANKIEYTNLGSNRFIAPTSRYVDSSVLRYSEENILTFETYKRKQYTPNSNDKFTVITKGYEFRPDLLSQSLYGLPDFWWRIMEVNNIWDIYDFKAGVNIRLPQNIFY